MLTRFKFTDQKLRGLKCPKGVQRQDFYDDGCPGLGLRLSAASGHRSWFLMYRRGHKVSRHTLGTFPQLSLVDARERARKYIGDKSDPAFEKKKRREALTFGELGDLFFEQGCKNLKPNSLAEWKRRFDTDLRPEFGRMVANQIEQSDIEKFLAAKAIKQKVIIDGFTRYKGGQYASNRCFELIRRIYNWGIKKKHTKSNPCHGLTRKEGDLFKEPERERWLNKTELKKLLEVLSTEPPHSRDFFEFVLLTGARKSEVLDMTTSQVDLHGSMWNKPQGTTKNSEAQPLPLSSDAMTIIKPRCGKPGDRLFPSPRTGNRFHPKTFLKRINDKMDLDAKSRFTVHDLRRTCATGLAELDTSQKVIDNVLGHSAQSLVRTYNKHRAIEETRLALTAWAKHLRDLQTSEVGKVLAMKEVTNQ